MISITPGFAINESEIEERFVRASGPGGQNINKVATAVQIRFHAAASPNLSEEVCERLRHIAGRRMTEDGIIIIDARRFRTQERNRNDARERLVELIRRAAIPPRIRRPTRPTAGARRARLEDKKLRSRTKILRRTTTDDKS
jgi:ribosome-associated protein